MSEQVVNEEDAQAIDVKDIKEKEEDIFDMVPHQKV